MRPEENEVAKSPPTVHAKTVTVFKHCCQGAGDAVDVGDDPESHDETLLILCVPYRRDGVTRNGSAIVA
jgi:hypothetical protein